MKVKRKIIQIDEELCDGCGQCVIACAEGSLEIIDGKARVIADNLCDGLGACIGECPQGALEIIEREAEAFDEEAVEAHLARRGQAPAADGEARPAAQGCPGQQIQQFAPAPADAEPQPPASDPASQLRNWPVQIALVPPHAPFLRGADLLLVADCVPIAFPALHQVFMQGRTVLIGCPKLDDAQAYIDKLAEIFTQAGLRRITVVMMEVPCCSGLGTIVDRALRQSGQTIPTEQVVVSTNGKILSRKAA
jgi:NAD-dependent dihydropyrimidine dehydrogenase PreA subunit